MTDIEQDIILLRAEVEQLKRENEKLREAITGAWLQLHTATFSTDKGAADLAKFIIAYLPAPPQKG